MLATLSISLHRRRMEGLPYYTFTDIQVYGYTDIQVSKYISKAFLVSIPLRMLTFARVSPTPVFKQCRLESNACARSDQKKSVSKGQQK